MEVDWNGDQNGRRGQGRSIPCEFLVGEVASPNPRHPAQETGYPECIAPTTPLAALGPEHGRKAVR